MSRIGTLAAAALTLGLLGYLPEAGAQDRNTPVGKPEGKDDPTAKPPATAFAGRFGEAKAKLLKEGGGTAGSERAVALGLEWLAKQQKQDGGWEFEPKFKENRAAATGMALLCFLGAGETHKTGDKYKDTVKKGLNYLMKACPPVDDPNEGRISANMYEQAIATIALVEAYGMTRDKELKPYAQAAIDHIQRAQGANGSWGYAANTDGDTSIVGWQIQALQAAKLSKDIVVDDNVIKSAIKFLDAVAAGERKSMYGYGDSAGAQPGTSLTAIGLLCRYYIDGWRPTHPGMVDGVTGLLKNPPAGKGGVKNIYYHYYAAQLVRFYEQEEWNSWNEGPKAADGTRKGGMRDWLVKAQVREKGANNGSWDPENGIIGSSCGRLGTTAMCVLTLEVYYRHLPLYKRGDKAIKIPEDK